MTIEPVNPADSYVGIRANGWTWDGRTWLPEVAAPVAPPYETPGMVVVVAAILTILTFGYTLPWVIAAQRNLPNQAAIGMLNIAFGWTVIGWFVCLVMACAQKRG